MEQSLKEARLKATRGRKGILSLLRKASGPLTAEELYRRMPEREISLSTVYRNLAVLTRRGLLIKTVGQDGVAAYQVKGAAHCHRIVCTVCGRQMEIGQCPLEPVVQKIGKETGFEVTGHSLEFTGICPTCRLAEDKKEKAK